MPNYNYECNEHGIFTVNCKMSEYKSTHKCPNCENECNREVKDMVSGGYKVNCSGFYAGSNNASKK